MNEIHFKLKSELQFKFIVVMNRGNKYFYTYSNCMCEYKVKLRPRRRNTIWISEFKSQQDSAETTSLQSNTIPCSCHKAIGYKARLYSYIARLGRFRLFPPSSKSHKNHKQDSLKWQGGFERSPLPSNDFTSSTFNICTSPALFCYRCLFLHI